MPGLLKVSSLMKAKGSEMLSVTKHKQELPIQIPLPDACKFHSIFCCPILKELSTPQNPPMMIPCGHVISKEAVHKLSKNLSK